MERKKKIILGVIMVIIILRIILVNTTLPSQLLDFLVGVNTEDINSFEDCVAAGYPVMESYPRQCRTSDDKTFVEDVCIEDSDCVVFGEDGDCNCGCYTKNNLPNDSGGDCFCAAPKSCKCTNGKCEGYF